MVPTRVIFRVNDSDVNMDKAILLLRENSRLLKIQRIN